MTFYRNSDLDGLKNQPHVLADLIRIWLFALFSSVERIQYRRAETGLFILRNLKAELTNWRGHERVSLALHPVPPAGRTWSAMKRDLSI